MFSTRSLDDSKDRFVPRKQNAFIFRPITAHITSNIISLHDKNLDGAIEIGITFMHILEDNWSEGLLDPITNPTVTSTWVGKPLKLGTEAVYDPAVTYGRFLGLQSSQYQY